MRGVFSGFFVFFVFFLNFPGVSGSEYPVESLEAAVALGKSNSKKLQLQSMQMLTDRALAKLSIKAFLPTLSLSLGESDSIEKNGADSRTKTAQVSITQGVFAGGRNKTQYDLANVTALYGWYEYHAAVLQLETEIAEVFRRCLLLEAKAQIQRELLSKTTLEAAIVAEEVRLGRALESEALEYAIQAAEAKLQVTMLKEEGARQKRNLSVLLGLPPQTELVLGDHALAPPGDFQVLPHFETLWPICKRSSVELKKQEVNLRYQKIQAAQARRFYVPTVTLEGALSFSGNRFPLTEPAYSFKCNLGFDNLFVPLKGSGAVNLRGGRLAGSSMSGGMSLPGNVTVGLEEKRAALAVRAGEMSLKDAENALYEQVLNAVQGHDNALAELTMKRNLWELAEKRLVIDEFRLRRGDLKRTEYLEKLVDAAKKKTEAAECADKLWALERAIEIAAAIPFGRLRESLEAP